MKKTTALLLVLACAAAVTLFAQGTPSDIPRINVEKFTLPNGLEVILSEDHRLPMTAVNLWYHVGPAYEEPGRTGFAHLFEHMMFQGSKHVPGDSHFRMLEGAGATGMNGTTNFDRTNYFETVPSNQLELALWLESDRMGFLLEQVDQAKLSNQQDVVRNERRQSYENRPYGVVDEGIYHALFPKGHPYYASVIGSHADIQAVRLDDVRQFFTRYYAPNNASLAIVGDIDKAATRTLVEKYFGSLKRGQPIPPLKVDTPAITAERRGVIEDRVELPRIDMAWLTPAAYTDGDADLEIAAGVLSAATSSRLYKSLVYEKQIAQDVVAYQYSLMLGSVFGIEATARPGHTAEELEAAIDEVLDRFRDEGPTAAEVQRVRNVLETRAMNALGSLNGVANRLNQYNHYLGTPDALTRETMRRRNVTPESTKRFAQQYLQRRNRIVVYGVPGQQKLEPETPRAAAEPTTAGQAAEFANVDEPWRATPPVPGSTRAAVLPVPQSFQLSNGLTVIFMPQASVPMVSATVVVRNGRDANPLDKPGLASFSMAMLDQGTSTRSALQLGDDIAQVGASLSTDSSTDDSTVTVSSLSRNFPTALSLLADVVLRPAFPAAEVERIRTTRLASLVQQRSSPTSIVGNVMSAVLYGQGHPYGFDELGTAASNTAMTREELQGFWRQNFVPGNAALVVAGAITPQELRKLAEDNFGGWPKGTVAPPSLPAPASARPKFVLVDRPGSPQTQLRIATIGAPRSSPDYIPLRVMNAILGGLFSSRININLREAHGYTYGARSQFTFSRAAGPFAVATGVRTDVTAPAVQEVFAEVKKMIETSVTPGELMLGKDAITQSLPASFETSGRTVANLTSLFTYGLPLNHYSRLNELVSVVDARAVQDMARKYLVPDNMVVVAVGDRARIGAPLEAALGPADLRDSEGLPLK
ncbi:MAG: insulinase family protein [Acidobacteria bacterium]|nr:insulinase family protein [Acidobacteriota bacterium]